MVAALDGDPRVKVLAAWERPGIDAALFKFVEKRTGPLDPAIKNFYLQANGLGVVWAPVEAAKGVRMARRARPRMDQIEHLPPEAGVIAVWPILEVFGVRPWRPIFDYAQYMPGAPPHWGFDFPGNYYTPAFVVTDAGARVKVGDDHGAAWDGPAVPFERYMEAVLATWGSVEARARVFVRGRGAAPKPWTLDEALAAART